MTIGSDGRARFLLYALSVIGSGCGFLTQILVSGYWSTAFSQDVLFFSLNTAFYFLSLGLGSLQSVKIERPRVSHLVGLTLFLGLLTGVSIPLLKLAIRGYGNLFLVPVAVVSAAGFAAGQIIPLTLRIDEAKDRIHLPVLFFLDYIAAICFSFLFTFVLLIPLGYTKTALVLAYACLLVTIALAAWSRRFTRSVAIFAALALLIPFPASRYHGDRATAPGWRAGNAMPSRVLINRQTHYQKIILTEERGTNPYYPDATEHVLYLDGFVQFNSLYEANYHFCLTNIPALAVQYQGGAVRRALVLGGGDGMVARNLLQTPGIERIDQVELDPAMIEISQTHPVMRRLNADSFLDKRVNLLPHDAFRWVRDAEKGAYDLIVIDFPDPKNITLSRLYSSEFYSFVWPLLAPKGVVAIQSGPIYDHEDEEHQTLSPVPTTVMKTLASIGKASYVYYSPRDLDAFVLATPSPDFDMDAFTAKIGIRADQVEANMCRYRSLWKVPDVAVNTLNRLPLTEHLLRWYEKTGSNFNYGGTYAVFLPE